MPRSQDPPDVAARLAMVAAAAAGRGVLARVAAVVEDIHLDIDGQRWVVWPVNGWWVTRLDADLHPVDPVGYVGPENLEADEVIDRVATRRVTVSPFNHTPVEFRSRSPDG